MARVLVAEDDALQSELVRRYLERDGHEVQIVADGGLALDLVAATNPNLLVLDVMLPGVDGLNVCRRLRETGSTLPVLMLTARSTENDLLLGLELGADDYLPKPYSPRELVARVRALLRRARIVVQDEQFQVAGDVRLDLPGHRCFVAGVLVELTATEFALLEAFVREGGNVLSRTQLLTRLHGMDRFITPRTIDAHVKNLRAKIEDDPAKPRRLTTVFGVGYRLATAGTERRGAS